MQNAALWQSVLGEIELSVSHATFTTWFKNTELVDQNESGVVISVPNIFAKKQFEVKFNDQVKGVLSKNGINPNKLHTRLTHTWQTHPFQSRNNDRYNANHKRRWAYYAKH
jgi:chromosomal replication initiation ATPase DnaA